MDKKIFQRIVPIFGVSLLTLAFAGKPASAKTAAEMLTEFNTDAQAAMTILSDLLLVIFGAALSGSTGYMAVSMYKRITGI